MHVRKQIGCVAQPDDIPLTASLPENPQRENHLRRLLRGRGRRTRKLAGDTVGRFEDLASTAQLQKKD